jgi:DNA-directed RNA polymerase delta subunit
VVQRRPNARRLNEISLADALEKVLRATKKPVHYKDLMATVVKRGIYKTRSKSLLSTVAVTLKRDGRFKKMEAGIWALKK